MTRSPPPPASRMGTLMRSNRATAPASTVSAAPVQVVPPVSLDSKAIADAVASGVSKAIVDLVSSGILVPAGAGSLATGVRSIAPAVTNDPVYIPSNIVPDQVAAITVAQTSTGGAELEASAAALKATRKRKTTSTEST